MLPSLSTATAATLPPRLPSSLSLYHGLESSPGHAQAAHAKVFKMENGQPAQGPSAHEEGFSSYTDMVTTTTLASRAKTNSERGKEFRAKRKKHEGELETAVYKLRNHIAELDMRKAVWEKQFLEARHTPSGSLVHLIQQYFSLFRFGLRDLETQPQALTGGKRALLPSTGSDLSKIWRQEEFISHIMDADAIVGERFGPSASLAQWRMYTISHDSLRNEPYQIITSGSEEHPCIEVYSNIHGRISRDTIRYMFPGALDNEKLIQKFLRREVVYKSVFRFHFTDDNRIAIETADIGIVEGLQDAGFALDDISQLMQSTVLTSGCMIPEASENAPQTPSPPPYQETHQGSPMATKLSLNFLLATDEDELRPDERVQEIAP